MTKSFIVKMRAKHARYLEIETAYRKLQAEVRALAAQCDHKHADGTSAIQGWAVGEPCTICKCHTC